jgi:hypothetical protein
MNRVVLSLPAIFLFLLLSGAKDPGENPQTYTVYINTPDGSVRADLLRENGRTKARSDRFYYWYSNNEIKQTQGGFDGKLLHGLYKSFYRNMNLKEQGTFSHGLKTGEWTCWYDNGRMQERIHFSNGIQDGYDEQYDRSGKLISKSKFRNGKPDGKTIIVREGKQDSVIIYKQGQPLPAKIKNVKEKKTKADSVTKNQAQKRVQDTAGSKPKSSRLFHFFHRNPDTASAPRNTPAAKTRKKETNTGKPSPKN